MLVFKITTGEELLARIDSVTDTELMLYRPCSLGMTQNGPSLNKWLVFADKDQPLMMLRSCIIAHATPDDEVRSHYESITSNIVKASADILNT